MEPRSSRAELPLTIEISDPAWRRLVPRVEFWVRRAFQALPDAPPASIVLGSDREVKRLNARFRGKNKPTNVLTFDPQPGQPGDMILASGVMKREAKAAGKRPQHHLAHLVLHGLLHLEGYEHESVRDAREMERLETWLLAKIGVPNPWLHQ
jgi:probable rRNA maturation factor